MFLFEVPQYDGLMVWWSPAGAIYEGSDGGKGLAGPLEGGVLAQLCGHRGGDEAVGTCHGELMPPYTLVSPFTKNPTIMVIATFHQKHESFRGAPSSAVMGHLRGPSRPNSHQSLTKAW